MTKTGKFYNKTQQQFDVKAREGGEKGKEMEGQQQQQQQAGGSRFLDEYTQKCFFSVFPGSASLCTYVLMIEYVGIKHRAIAIVYLSCFWSLSLMTLALWGYLFRDWLTLSIAGAVPGFLVIFAWW